jgi:hypothetical protein
LRFAIDSEASEDEQWDGVTRHAFRDAFGRIGMPHFPDYHRVVPDDRVAL